VGTSHENIRWVWPLAARTAQELGDADAVGGLRRRSTPYHLAHGQVDHAAWLIAHGDSQAAVAAVSEATAIAVKLGCQPLLDCAAALAPEGAPPRG
jgi:hypothetical protein